MLTPTAVSIVIVSLCVLLFIRNLLTTYYATPKFEEKINVILNAMSRKLDMIDKIINHNTNRMAIDIPKAANIASYVHSFRARMNASRTYILRFHNGSSFSTNDPVWKVSMIHESTDNAIRPVSDKTKDILISSIIHFVHPIFDKNICKNIDGITAITNDDEFNVFEIDTEKINLRTLKGFFASRGTKHLYYTAIVNNENRPIGILCLDYTDTIPSFVDNDFIKKEMIECSSILSSLFN